MPGGRERQPIRKALVLIGRHDPLARHVRPGGWDIGGIQVTKILWFVVNLLIAGRFQGHDPALSGNVSKGQNGNGYRPGSGRRPLCRRVGIVRLGVWRERRRAEVHGQRQVAGHGSVQDHVPQHRRYVGPARSRARHMPLLNDADDRVQRYDLDLLTNGRRQ